jgi:uncharacterized protein with HEPN domain
LPSRKPARRFRDIVDNIGWIADDVRDISESEFLDDRTLQDAVLFRLLRISEAAAKLRPDADRFAPEQPWQQIRALGNALRHEYDGVALAQVWIIVRRDLPALLQSCTDALARIERD